ncbi:hypothetical protein HDE_03830 [Halotydeus destructor]|nr:hypothetical protein HDE_03830 [Halotydeus destructor]
MAVEYVDQSGQLGSEVEVLRVEDISNLDKKLLKVSFQFVDVMWNSSRTLGSNRTVKHSLDIASYYEFAYTLLATVYMAIVLSVVILIVRLVYVAIVRKLKEPSRTLATLIAAEGVSVVVD